jgi:hypothetical protein
MDKTNTARRAVVVSKLQGRLNQAGGAGLAFPREERIRFFKSGGAER